MRPVRVYLVLVIVMSTILLSCGGAEERKAKYLERGKRYFAENNYEKATVELKNVLQIDPKDADAYFVLGEISEKKDDISRAFGNYSKVVELNPSHIGARVKLAKIYFSVGQVDKAEEHVNYVLAKEPKNAEAKTLRAYILAQKGDVPGAVKLANEVMNADPKQSEAAILIATVERQHGKIDKAIAVLEQSVRTNPKDVHLLSVLAQTYFAAKDQAKAADALQRIISIKPDALQPRTNLALFYSQTQQPDKAEKTLREAIKAKPDDPERYLVLADFLISHHKAESFESELIAATKAHPAEKGLRFALAMYYLKLDRLADAEKTYRQIIDLDPVGPDGMKARKDLAELYLKENKPADASTLIAQVLKDNPQDTQALFVRGKIEMSQAIPDAKAAISDFRSVLKSQPDSLEVLTLLSRAHEMNNEPSLAREALQKAVKVAPKAADATVRLARFLMLNDNDMDGALKVLNEFLARSPGNLPVMEAKLAVLSAKGDAQGIADTIASLKQLYPDKPVGYFHAGEFLSSQQKYQEALAEFEKARERAKTEFRPVEAIAKTYLKLGDRAQAIKTLDDFLAANPSNLDAMQTRASILASDKDPAAFFKAVDAIKRSFPDKPYGYFLAGEYFLNQKTYGKALDELKTAAAKGPGVNKITEELIKAYLGAGQGDAAVAWLETTAKSKPSDPSVPYYIGIVRAFQGKSPEAIAAFRESLKLGPKGKDTYMKLAKEYMRQHDFDAAVKVFQQGLEALPNDDDLRFSLASTYEAQGRFDDAIAVYDQLLKKNPRNILAANNLASLLTDHKGDKESLARAKTLAAPFENSNQPALLDTLGWIYVKLDDPDRAIPLLKKATAAAPKAAILHYHLGMAYFKKGDKVGAKEQLSSAFAADPQLAGAEDGRAILKGL